MAPAFAHFAIGGAIGLLALACISLRYPRTLDYRLSVLVLCGIWATVPDIHHAIALFDPALGHQARVIHDTPWADVFFLHYTLDRAIVRAHAIETIGIAAALLVVAWATTKIRVIQTR